MMLGRRIAIRGTVQGVGFRPWVFRLAEQLGVGGRVRNEPEGVTIDAFGGAEALDAFILALRDARKAIPAARVRRLEWSALEGADLEGAPATAMVIEHSRAAGDRVFSVPADLATCPACLAELRDPADRRAGYAFTNCTNCGPRFTIVTDVPYDRPATTMAGFEMCPACRAEYEDPSNRRFHAQPNACPVCGPKLELRGGDPGEVLAGGGILAVKGLGGFHLACDARNEEAVQRLRTRKRREAKPFAVMVPDLAAARELAHVSDEEEALLLSPARPIVLCRRRADAVLAPSVAPDTDLVGLFLPYTPLHHLIVDRPLVMTSGNLADEPIARTNEEAETRLADIADAYVLHDREIASRADDSVARVIAGAPVLLRRSRGWVPAAVALRRPVKAPILACGAQLKNTFALARGDSAWLGPHIGDLDNLEAFRAYEDAIARMEKLLAFTPEIIAHDHHPDYMSTRYAEERPAIRRVPVQHHHAHVAAAMAEHGLGGHVLGLAWDGTGLGTDGAAWGGELFLACACQFRRLATFRPVALAGGDRAIKEPWRLALAAVDDAFGDGAPIHELPLFQEVDERDLRVVNEMLAGGFGVVQAHGVGRWFDAIAALAFARPVARYEGELPMALEAAARGEHGTYPVDFDFGREPWQVDMRPLVRAVVHDVLGGTRASLIAARFHGALIRAASDLLAAARLLHGDLPVIATGGCFANARLAEGLLAEVPALLHREVPPGDGGLALGQILVAASSLEEGADRCA